MTILGTTFIFAVLTAYTLYRYYITRSKFIEELAITHVIYGILYSIYMIWIIHAGSKLKQKVNTFKNHKKLHRYCS